MQEIEKKIINKARLLKDEYDELKMLIEAPEILADNLLWRRFVKRHQRLERVASELELLELALIERDDGNEAAGGEITKLITELAILMSADESQNIDFAIQLEWNSDEGSALKDIILSSYQSYLDFVDCQYSTDTSGNMASIRLCGNYEKFKNENGTHSGISIGKNKASGKVFVSVTKEFKDIKVDEVDNKDIRIDVFHSGGAGGQHINKTESAVRMTHLPTGIVVVCQDERSQIQNRERAMQNLMQKLAQHNSLKKKEFLAAHKREFPQNRLVRTYDLAQNLAYNDRAEIELDVLLSGGISLFFFEP